MSELTEEFPSTTSDDFGFKSVGKSIQLVSDFNENLPFKAISNFAYSPLIGIFAAAGATDLLIGDLKSLKNDVDDEEKTSYETQAKKLNVSGINSVSFTRDHKYIVISVGSAIKFSKITRDSYQSLTDSSFQTIDLATEIDKVIPSYASGSVLYALGITGILQSVNLSTKSSSSINTNVADFDLSPDNGNIIILKSNLIISTLDSSGKQISSVQTAAEIMEDRLSPLAITWLKDNLFFVSYGEEVKYEKEDEPQYEFKQYIVDTSSKPATFSESFDSIPAFGTVWRKPIIYRVTASKLSRSLQTLNILASSTSTDISPLTDIELLEPLNDSERAALPMNDTTGNDVNAIGLILDTRSTERVVEPCAGVSEADWLPILWVLGSDGKVLGWYIFHVADLRNKNFKADNLHALEERIAKTATAGSTRSSDQFKTSDDFSQKNAFASSLTEKSDSLFASLSLEKDTRSTPESTEFALKNEQQKENAFLKLGASDSKPPLFGSKTTEGAQPTFGAFSKDSASTSKPSIFGTSTESKSLFGNESANPQESGSTKSFSFGSNKPSPFGSSVFGSSENKISSGSSTFGSTETKPVFGSSVFGSSGDKPAFGTSGFGTSGFGTSGFGTSGFGYTPQSKLGGVEPKPASHEPGSSTLGSSGTSASSVQPNLAFGTPSFGSSGFGNIASATTSVPSKSGFGSTSSGFAAFANKPSLGEAASTKGSPFGNLGSDKKAESPFENLASSTEAKAAPHGSSTNSESPFGTLRGPTDNKTSVFGSSIKKESPFAKLGSSNENKPSPFGSLAGSASPFVSSTKSESPFGTLGDSKDTKPLQFGGSGSSKGDKHSSFGSSPKPESPFGRLADSVQNEESLFGGIGYSTKSESPFGSSFQFKPEAKSSPFGHMPKDGIFAKIPTKEKKDVFSFQGSGFTESLESEKPNPEEERKEEKTEINKGEEEQQSDEEEEEEETEEEQQDDEGEQASEEEGDDAKEEISYEFDFYDHDREEEEQELHSLQDGIKGASLEDHLEEGSELEEEVEYREPESDEEPDEGDEVEQDLTDDYETSTMGDESFKGFGGDSTQDFVPKFKDKPEIEQEAKIDSHKKEDVDDIETKSVSLKSSDEELYEKAKLLEPSGAPIDNASAKKSTSAVDYRDAGVQSTVETRDREVSAETKKASTHVQTEPTELKSVHLQAFEDDEIYAGAQSLPAPISPYIQLKDVKYPALSSNPVVRELEKILYDTDAELEVIQENSENIGRFIQDHLNPKVQHTEVSLGHSYQWRISEATNLVDILNSKIPNVESTREGLTSNLKIVESIQQELISYHQQTRNITEKELAVEKSEDKVIIDARDLPFETLVLQEKVRKHHGIVVSKLREAEQKLLSLKAAANVLTEDFSSTNVLEGVITYINDVTRNYASDTKKLTEQITKLNKKNEEIIKKLSSSKADEFKEKEYNNRNIGKLKIDDVTRRVAIEASVSRVLRSRSINDITSQF